MTPDLRTTVTFQSSAFNSTEPREYFINPDCFGDDLCKWMIAKLTAAGIKYDPEPGQEDFGWYFNFSPDDILHCFICGFRPGDDSDPAVWLGWVEHPTNFLSSPFGGRHKGITLQALQQIHNTLSDAPEISNLRWHYKRDFDAGNEDLGATAPD